MMKRNIYQAQVGSNIALLKYWGKLDERQQIPANASLSMTLSESYSVVQVVHNTRTEWDCFYYEGKRLEPCVAFAQKAYRHMNFLRNILKPKYYFDVYAYNSFPSGCGIASSASSMAALTLAYVMAALEADNWSQLALRGATRQQLAYWARFGSGSACRSLWGGFVVWDPCGQDGQQFVGPIVDASYWPLSDIIVVVSAQEKSVSSSQGHRRAWSSPYYKDRLDKMPVKLARLKDALLNRHIEKLGALIEEEAIDMHRIMHTSQPPLIYYGEDTEKIMSWLQKQRRARKIPPAYFTLDAGPNMHLISEACYQTELAEYVRQAFPQYPLILDQQGGDPQLKVIPTASESTNLLASP